MGQPRQHRPRQRHRHPQERLIQCPARRYALPAEATTAWQPRSKLPMPDSQISSQLAEASAKTVPTTHGGAATEPRHLITPSSGTLPVMAQR